MNRKGLLLIAAASLLAAAAYLLGWSSLFTVKSVAFNGALNSQSREVVTELVGDMTGQKLARIEPRRIKGVLEDVPWIDRANVSRNWMTGKVSVNVTPRNPIALYGTRYLDRSGALFEIPGSTYLALPRVDAPTPSLGIEAIDLFTSLPEVFQGKLAHLEARNESSFIFTVTEGGRTISVRWGGKSDGDLKVKVYEALIARPENKTITRIDLSAPHAPIVK